MAAASPAPAAPPRLPALHAVPDRVRGGRIADSSDRQVLLREVNALADYWAGSRFRTVFPLAAYDPRRMATIGWDAVRLLVSWSRVEPRPGVYDERYLNRVAAAVKRLRRQAIYSIVDLHQDAWGAALAARPGETCQAPLEPALGWDGAPAWATFDGGQPHCFPGIRELSPAVLHAWQSFWTSHPGPGAVGIQSRYVTDARPRGAALRPRPGGGGLRPD